MEKESGKVPGFDEAGGMVGLKPLFYGDSMDGCNVRSTGGEWLDYEALIKDALVTHANHILRNYQSEVRKRNEQLRSHSETLRSIGNKHGEYMQEFKDKLLEQKSQIVRLKENLKKEKAKVKALNKASKNKKAKQVK